MSKNIAELQKGNHHEMLTLFPVQTKMVW